MEEEVLLICDILLHCGDLLNRIINTATLHTNKHKPNTTGRHSVATQQYSQNSGYA
jgi:hypothetical protein